MMLRLTEMTREAPRSGLAARSFYTGYGEGSVPSTPSADALFSSTYPQKIVENAHEQPRQHVEPA